MYADGDDFPGGFILRCLLAKEVCEKRVARVGQVQSPRLFVRGGDYFRRRQERTLRGFAALARETTHDPLSLARQVVALMDGLQIQWLRAPETTDLVAEWRAAAAKIFADPR